MSRVLRVDGISVAVEEVPRIHITEEAHGEFISQPTPHIRLAEDLPDGEWKHYVLLHEWVHAVLFVRGLSSVLEEHQELEELVCNAIASEMVKGGLFPDAT